eukprot:gene15919-22053_t
MYTERDERAKDGPRDGRGQRPGTPLNDRDIEGASDLFRALREEGEDINQEELHATKETKDKQLHYLKLKEEDRLSNRLVQRVGKAPGVPHHSLHLFPGTHGLSPRNLELSPRIQNGLSPRGHATSVGQHPSPRPSQPHAQNEHQQVHQQKLHAIFSDSENEHEPLKPPPVQPYNPGYGAHLEAQPWKSAEQTSAQRTSAQRTSVQNGVQIEDKQCPQQTVAEAHPDGLPPPMSPDPNKGAVVPPDGRRDLSAGELAEPSEHVYDEVGDLSQTSHFRKRIAKMAFNPDFEFFVTLIILGNCITLCAYDPMEPDDSKHNMTIFWVELGFNIIYTVEMILRIIAYGGLGNYLKVPWNVFDVFMVLIGYTALIPTGDSDSSAIKALRALRALRPLRTITRFESLRSVIVCFLEALPLLTAAMVVVTLFLFLFAVASVQMFVNVFHNICAMPINESLPELEYVFEDAGDDPDMFGCSSPTGGWWNRECPENFTSVSTAGFDNTGLAMMTNWQVFTLSGWYFIMFHAIDNTSPFAGIYFLLLLVLGAYCVMNLFIAVLKVKFAKAQTVFIAEAKMRSMNLFIAVLKAKFAKAQTVFVAKAKLRSTKKRKNTMSKFFSAAKSKVSTFASARSQNSLMSKKMTSVASVIHSQLSRRSSMDDFAGAETNKPRGSKKAVAEGTERQDPTMLALLEQVNGSKYDPSRRPARSSSKTLRQQSIRSRPSSNSQGQLLDLVLPSSAPTSQGQMALALNQTQPQSNNFNSEMRLSNKNRAFNPEMRLSNKNTNSYPGSRLSNKDRTLNPEMRLSNKNRNSNPESRLSNKSKNSSDEIRFSSKRIPDAKVGAPLGDAAHEEIAKASPMVGKESSSNPGALARDSSAPLGLGPSVAPDGAVYSNQAIASLMSIEVRQEQGAGENRQGAGDMSSGQGDMSRGHGHISSGQGDRGLQAREFDEFVADMPLWQRSWLKLQFRLRKFVMHPMFDNIFLIVILINTIMLAMEYDGMGGTYLAVLVLSNYVFTGLFTVELIVKLMGMGFWEYVQDYFNVFDAFIVVVSLLEIVLTSIGGMGALRALRALRVLRVLKLFKYVKSLRKIGEVMLTCFASFFSIMVLLILFWIVYAIIGLHVFGGTDLPDTVWPNFDTFLNSLSDYGTFFYYMTWIFIGKYVCVSLFLAVMLESFEAKYDANAKGGEGQTGASDFRSSVGGSFKATGSMQGSMKYSSMERTSPIKPLPPPGPPPKEIRLSPPVKSTNEPIDIKPLPPPGSRLSPPFKSTYEPISIKPLPPLPIGMASGSPRNVLDSPRELDSAERNQGRASGRGPHPPPGGRPLREGVQRADGQAPLAPAGRRPLGEGVQRADGQAPLAPAGGRPLEEGVEGADDAQVNLHIMEQLEARMGRSAPRALAEADEGSPRAIRLTPTPPPTAPPTATWAPPTTSTAPPTSTASPAVGIPDELEAMVLDLGLSAPIPFSTQKSLLHQAAARRASMENRRRSTDRQSRFATPSHVLVDSPRPDPNAAPPSDSPAPLADDGDLDFPELLELTKPTPPVGQSPLYTASPPTSRRRSAMDPTPSGGRSTVDIDGISYRDTPSLESVLGMAEGSTPTPSPPPGVSAHAPFPQGFSVLVLESAAALAPRRASIDSPSHFYDALDQGLSDLVMSNQEKIDVGRRPIPPSTAPAAASRTTTMPPSRLGMDPSAPTPVPPAAPFYSSSPRPSNAVGASASFASASGIDSPIPNPPGSGPPPSYQSPRSNLGYLGDGSSTEGSYNGRAFNPTLSLSGHPQAGAEEAGGATPPLKPAPLAAVPSRLFDEDSVPAACTSPLIARIREQSTNGYPLIHNSQDGKKESPGLSMSPVFQASEQAHTNLLDSQSGAPSAKGFGAGSYQPVRRAVSKR